MKKADKQRRNRAKSCNMCGGPMTMADRKLYQDGVAHRSCAYTDNIRRINELLDSSCAASKRTSEALDRLMTRARAHQLGLWVP